MEKVIARNNHWTKQRKADAQEEPKRNARNWSTVAETADAWAGRGCVKTLLCREREKQRGAQSLGAAARGAAQSGRGGRSRQDSCRGSQ